MDMPNVTKNPEIDQSIEEYTTVTSQ